MGREERDEKERSKREGLKETGECLMLSCPLMPAFPPDACIQITLEQSTRGVCISSPSSPLCLPGVEPFPLCAPGFSSKSPEPLLQRL